MSRSRSGLALGALLAAVVAGWRGDLWFYPGDNAGGFGSPRQPDSGWNVMNQIG